MRPDFTAARPVGPLPALRTRAVRFEEVPEVLRLIQRAVEAGCRDHYDARQRRAVTASYAAALFVEIGGPYLTIAAEEEGELPIAVAQLDVASCRLRALFVDAGLQRRGVGRLLLADVEGRARTSGCARLHGAMSLNAVSFYQRAGFRVCAGPPVLSSAPVAVPVVRMEKEIQGGTVR